MSTLGYKYTPEQKQRMRLAQLGKKRSLETRRKISEVQIGRIPWNKGIKVKDDIRIKKFSDAGRKKLSEKFAEGYLPKSAFKKGMTPWNKGLKGFRAGSQHHYFGKKRPEFSGVNHPLWKGIKYTDSRRERTRFRTTLQKLILERDDYKCQICDSGGDLQVDHIASWAEFKELRFDPDNCRTLCAKCHYKVTFGREMPKNIKGWGHNKIGGQIS